MQQVANYCSTLQYSAFCLDLQYITTYPKILQYKAVYCYMLPKFNISKSQICIHPMPNIKSFSRGHSTIMALHARDGQFGLWRGHSIPHAKTDTILNHKSLGTLAWAFYNHGTTRQRRTIWTLAWASYSTCKNRHHSESQLLRDSRVGILQSWHYTPETAIGTLAWAFYST